MSAAPVSHLNGEYFHHELRREVGSNGHTEMNAAMKSALCPAHIELGD